MKTHVRFFFLFVLCLSTGFLFAQSTIEVSGHTGITNNSSWDRNPSVTFYNGEYWLFYTKADNDGVRGVSGYNPDNELYIVWYKHAASIPELATATETKLSLSETARPVGFDQRLASAVAFNGSLYAFVSCGYSQAIHPVYFYKWDGSSWTGPTTLATAGAAHVNAVADADRVYLAVNSNPDNVDVYTWDGTTVNGPYNAGSANIVPKITLKGGTLYVISIAEPSWTSVEVWSGSASATPSFSYLSAPYTATGSAMVWDPTIFNDNTNLYVVVAPQIGDAPQWLAQTYSTDNGSTWSTSKNLSYGGYGSTYWWDFWPNGYFDGTNKYLFFGTEGNGTTYGDAEIAYLKMDWNLSNDHYFFVQNGIDKANSGDVINVAAGTYTGNINVNKSLTIVGDPGDASPGPGINAPVIDGGSLPGDAFLIANAVTNVTIKGFEMRNFTSPLLNGIGNGISAWVGSTSYITIQDNYFHHLGYNGVLVGNDYSSNPLNWGDHSNWLIKNNIIENFGYIGFELTNTSNSSIEGNIIHMATPYIGAIFSSARRSETGLTIKNNLIDGTPSTLYPVIYIYAYDLDMPNPNLNNVLIEDNTIATVGTPFQIYIRNIGTGTITGVQAHYNSISTFKNLTSAQIDASSNWWGSTDPIVVNGKISGTVDFTPILNSGTDTDPGTMGFQPDLSILTVHTLGSQAGTTGRIQEGVNLVSGSTVNVAAGTYTEQVVINKNLTLSGNGNPMFKAPASPTGYTFTEGLTNVWEPVVFVFGGTLVGTAVSGTGQVTVNISGIIVDGNSRIPSPTSRRAVGILYRNALGGVEHSTVQNMGYSTTFPNSWGIMAYGTSDVTFHGNTVSGYAKGGFVVNGVLGYPAMAKPHAVIDSNTVTGPPYDPLLLLAPNGIQIGWGATGSVTNNTATHHGSPGTVWGGTGILIQSSPDVLVEGNKATDNADYGIATSGYDTDLSPATGTIIRDNIIERNGWGIYVNYRSVNTLIEDNQITGNDIGIRVGSSTAGYRMNTPPVNTDINNNSIYENITSGVDVATNTLQEEVDATYNYWGSVHGPLDSIGTVEMPGNPSTPVADMKNTIPADKLGNAVSEKVDYYKWQGKNNPNASGGGIWAGGYVNPSSNDIFAGFDPAASDGVDLRDTVAPPPPPSDYLYLYFLLAPGEPLENYSYDVKKEEAILATAAKHWDLKALTDHTSELVTIEFPLAGLPDGFKPTLYDLATGKYQNLRDNPFYEYTSPVTIVPSSFLILIGDSTKPTVSVTAPNGGEFLVVGQPYSITWSSSDGTGVLRHYIYWSSTGASPYTLIDSVNGNVYSYNWTPTLASNTASVKVTARDSVMNEETDISNNTFWILATNSASFSAIAGWNLVSIPLQQTDMSPVGVFGDDYAVPYYTFQYNASGGYSVPSTLIMGQGYWLGSNSAQVVDAVGTPLSTVDFALTNGFNIIGNPYVVSILKSDLRFTNGVNTKTMVEAATAGWLSNVLYGYNGGYIVEGTTLGVWNGYWIPMLVSGITIQYRTGLGVPSPIAVPTLATDIAEGWGVDIGVDLLVNGEKVSDHIASFGVNPKATAGFDPVFDAPRPPRSPFDRYVEVSFVVDGENYPNSAIGRDYQNSSEGGWEFLVTASHEGTVTLTWDNSTISQLPSDINVELNDVATGQVIDMKRTSSYSFDQTGTTRRFLVNRDDKEMPVSFELIQNYPNPFNPTTKLQYGLPADANVKVVIFDYLGRQVAVLTDGFVNAGYHEVSFDASQLASGVYIYRLTAIGINGTHFFDSKKMILAR